MGSDDEENALGVNRLPLSDVSIGTLTGGENCLNNGIETCLKVYITAGSNTKEEFITTLRCFFPIGAIQGIL
jgi:hypothetical protein